MDNDSDATGENDTDKVQQSSPNGSYTVEQEQLFRCRFAEGYNILINADYVRWLKLHHPECRPSDGSDSELNNDSVISQLSDIIPASPVSSPIMEESEELTSHFEFANLVDKSMTDIPISTTDNTVSAVGPSTSNTSPSIPCLSTSSAPLVVQHPSTSNTPLSVPCSSTSSTLSTSILGTPVHICTTISPVLQQLETPACSTKGRETSQARLLTSDESLAQLQEKEKKKEEQAE